MEYTKDMILHVNYGQEVRAKRKGWNLFYKIVSVITGHKIITAVVSITFMLMILDIMLVSSFVNVLSTINF